MDKVELPPIPAELLQSCPTQAQECVAAWHNLAQQLLLQNKLLQAQLAELQNQLNQNSQNSSKPPSSDPPFKRSPKTKNNNSKTKSPKAKGGQVGHTKQQRTLLAPDQVDLIVTAPHPTCPNPTCQKALTASNQVGAVLRQQVWELPPVKSQVTEYQTAHNLCGACHTHTRSQLPTQVPKRRGTS